MYNSKHYENKNDFTDILNVNKGMIDSHVGINS